MLANTFRSRRRCPLPLPLGLLLAVVACGIHAHTAAAALPRFELRFDPQVRAEPYSGRVYLMFSSKNPPEPRSGPNWFRPEPFAAVDVQNWQPGAPLHIDLPQAERPDAQPRLTAFPKPLSQLDLAGYHVQAVARFNPHERRVGTGPGNGFSATATLPAAGEQADLPTLKLTIDRLVPEPKFPETAAEKLLAVRSDKLSRFHDRDVVLRASVLLPPSYETQPERRYPVLYVVPGFGGTHIDGGRYLGTRFSSDPRVEFIRVTLDPSCPLGHHVFADSANNGPYGTALTTEFIPALDRQFRTIPQSTARFLTGHSSGGWSTLWLQVTYPQVFGGVWSTAPDPVDFRDFQRIDMYRPGENMYRDARGDRRPLAHDGDRVLLWYDDFDHMEWTLGYGGQLHSFEAVFSPRGPNGQPRLAWDRTTGAVDAAVTEAWKQYDIRLILEENWEQLGPQLQGKLHVIMGDADTFYLEGATQRLQQSLRQLGSDARVELVPGKNHFNLLTPALLDQIRREMTAQFLKHHPVD